MNTFIRSDDHFFHTNIIKYCARPFDYVQEMNEHLIEEHNKVVKPEDEVIYLGDLGLCGPEQLMPIRNRMNGIWKYFIAGNHDRKTLLNSYGLAETVIKYNIFKTVELEINNTKFVLSHVPLPVEKMYPGNVYLSGHTHTPIKRYSCRYPHFNIGVDAWEYKPVEIEEIKALL